MKRKCLSAHLLTLRHGLVEVALLLLDQRLLHLREGLVRWEIPKEGGEMKIVEFVHYNGQTKARGWQLFLLLTSFSNVRATHVFLKLINIL